MAAERNDYEVVVVGAGMGGLAAAALAQARGLRTALCEAHTKLGGCAGYFSRGLFTFDAGATALMGLEPTAPIGRLLDEIGLKFRAAATPYRIVTPDRTFAFVADRGSFERTIAEVFPGRDEAKRDFWRLQSAVGSRLFDAAEGIPRLPIRSLGDIAHDLRVLGLGGVLAATTSLVTTLDILRVFGLADDQPFRTLIAMLLQDTAQAGPETVPFANAAACLEAYRRGLRRPVGGMKALAEGIGRRFVELGGVLHKGTLVDRVDRDGAGHFVVTRRGERFHARTVVLNLPIDLAAKLCGRPLRSRPARAERKSRARWSAVTAYVAFPREALAEGAPLFHHVLQSYDGPIHDGNNALISLSSPGDAGYGPSEYRTATISTHVDSVAWSRYTSEEYSAAKETVGLRLRRALARALPEVEERAVHCEFAGPRSFARYTRRTLGAVGGPPVARGNSNFFAVGDGVLGPGIRLVGDSVFPGQGTMATVLSAMRVIERLTDERPAGRPVGVPTMRASSL